jgi:hypothetical protein
LQLLLLALQLLLQALQLLLQALRLLLAFKVCSCVTHLKSSVTCGTLL